MELLLTLDVPGSERRFDLSAELDPLVPVAALCEALAAWAGERGVVIPPEPALLLQGSGGSHRALDPTLPAVDAGVVSGSTVRLVDSASRYRYSGAELDGAAAGEPAVSLDVTSGPDAGRTIVLRPGRHSVGRSPGSDVQLRDRTLSWAHCTLAVAADLSVTVEPNAEARNGTFVSAEELHEPRELRPEEAVVAGRTQFVLRGPVIEAVGRRDWLGQVTFNPIPYRRPLVRERDLAAIPRPPDRPGERRFPLLATLVPIAAAVLIVYFTRQVIFISVALLSPLMIVSNYFSEGRNSRKNYARDRGEFESRIAERADEVSSALEEERRERLAAAPDVAFLGRQAAGRLGRLWERPRGSPDFLEVRVGLGPRKSRIATPVEPGGETQLREWADQRLAHHSSLDIVPVTVSLDEAGVTGLHGSHAAVQDLAMSLLLQAACLHSPEQLVLAAAVPGSEIESWAWLKWLPHTRSATSPLEGAHLVAGGGVDDLVRRVAAVAAARSGAERPGAEQGSGGWWPRLLLVVHERAGPDRAALSALLDVAPQAGIVCLWVGDDASQLPRQCQVVIAAGEGESVVRHTDPHVEDDLFEPEGSPPDTAERIARCLAPVRDVSAANATTGIPRLVTLFDLPGIPLSDPRSIAARWARGAGGYRLEAVLGVGVDGPFGLDLVGEGPHALVAGTSGAGKSELLQTFVCTLAGSYPPERVNFLFIDYKGGASSAPFAGLPHTVGSVSNLDERMALRALVSLRAELQRRMALLEGRAKDLAEMLEVAPAEAPPSLVIVVDEFATLVREIPDFVAGMVDVAQRGRSLGIHLVLATQRPTGAVNDNILANTNLRIALRVLDAADSTSVIGAKDAAAIPVPLRGRAYARTGPGSLMAFQCAWSGAPFLPAGGDARVAVRPFPFGEDPDPAAHPASPSHASDDRPPTQLEVFVRAAASAHAASGAAPPRRPWVEPLPELVTLDQTLRSDPAGEASRRADPGRHVVVGAGDFPAEQRRAVVSVDLEADGGLMVFGSGGSGKTTLLRTVAAGLARQGSPDEVRIYVLDFAGRSLAHLEDLPHVAAVAAGDDLEKVTRTLTVLRGELDRRRRLLSDARAESVSALRARRSAAELPRLVLLVDSYAGFHSTFEAGPLYDWIEQFVHLVSEGRQAGIHVVLTNNRLLGVPTAITSAIAARLVLRMATSDEMISLGVRRQSALGADLPPGRGFVGPSTEVQVAAVSAEGSGSAQAAALEQLSADLRAGGMQKPPGLLALPDVVSLAAGTPAAPAPFCFAIGVADLTHETVEVDVRHQNLVVVGPPLSGRSTTLETALAGLRAGTTGVTFVGVGSLTSPLAVSGYWDVPGFGRSRHAAALQQAAEMVAGYEGEDIKVVLFIDTLEDFEGMEYAIHMDPLLRSDAVRVLAACDRAVLDRAYSGWIADLRRNRSVLVLQPASPADVEDQTRVRPSLRPGQAFPPGRGVLVARATPTLLQVGYPAPGGLGPAPDGLGPAVDVAGPPRPDVHSRPGRQVGGEAVGGDQAAGVDPVPVRHGGTEAVGAAE